MSESWRCCGFLLVTILTALFSGIISKSVCVGDSVQVFQNITPASCNLKITLYKIGAGRQEAIAIWYVNNSTEDDKIPEQYKSKVFFENGAILLRNIQPSDEANYTIVYDIDRWSDRKEAEILAHAPPSTSCKPKITHVENHLLADLDTSEYCGKPAVSVYWKECDGICYRDKTAILLPPGKEAGTYYACLEGDALKCAKNKTAVDHCEHVTIGSTEGNTNPVLSQLKSNSNTILAVVSVVLFLVFLVLVVSILSIYFGKNCASGTHGAPRTHQSVPQEEL